MGRRSAIVIGAGIGGLSAACGLARVGWQVRVFEQASALHEVGAGLSIAPNAMKALEWLGFGPRVRTKAQGQGIGVKTTTGRWLTRLDERDLTDRFGNPMFAMHRADLHQILLDEASANATVHTSHRVTEITPDRVTAATPNGPVVATADLVVAADGVHSRIRSGLYPQHRGATYAGYTCWRCIAPAPSTREPVNPPVWTDSWGRGVRFGAAPLTGGRVFWYASLRGPEGRIPEQTLEQLAARFRDWHPPIVELITSSRPEALLRNDVYFVRDPVPSFVDGRVVLLGDAAHAVTPDIGQGACLAVEDAVVLAAATAGTDDLDAALRHYDETRRPRTQNLARISGRSARVQQVRNPIGATLRDQFVRLTPKRTYLNAAADALGWTPPPAPARRQPQP